MFICSYLKPSAIMNVENGRVFPIVLAAFHKFLVVIQLVRVTVVEYIGLNSKEILIWGILVDFSYQRSAKARSLGCMFRITASWLPPVAGASSHNLGVELLSTLYYANYNMEHNMTMRWRRCWGPLSPFTSSSLPSQVQSKT